MQHWGAAGQAGRPDAGGGRAAQTLRRLEKCPYVCRLVGEGGTGVHEGRAYLVMELLGASLAQLRGAAPGHRFEPALAQSIGVPAGIACLYHRQSRQQAPSRSGCGAERRVAGVPVCGAGLCSRQSWRESPECAESARCGRAPSLRAADCNSLPHRFPGVHMLQAHVLKVWCSMTRP